MSASVGTEGEEEEEVRRVSFEEANRQNLEERRARLGAFVGGLLRSGEDVEKLVMEMAEMDCIVTEEEECRPEWWNPKADESLVKVLIDGEGGREREGAVMLLLDAALWNRTALEVVCGAEVVEAVILVLGGSRFGVRVGICRKVGRLGEREDGFRLAVQDACKRGVVGWEWGLVGLECWGRRRKGERREILIEDWAEGLLRAVEDGSRYGGASLAAHALVRVIYGGGEDLVGEVTKVENWASTLMGALGVEGEEMGPCVAVAVLGFGNMERAASVAKVEGWEETLVRAAEQLMGTEQDRGYALTACANVLAGLGEVGRERFAGLVDSWAERLLEYAGRARTAAAAFAVMRLLCLLVLDCPMRMAEMVAVDGWAEKVFGALGRKGGGKFSGVWGLTLVGHVVGGSERRAGEVGEVEGWERILLDKVDVGRCPRLEVLAATSVLGSLAVGSEERSDLISRAPGWPKVVWDVIAVEEDVELREAGARLLSNVVQGSQDRKTLAARNCPGSWAHLLVDPLAHAVPGTCPLLLYALVTMVQYVEPHKEQVASESDAWAAMFIRMADRGSPQEKLWACRGIANMAAGKSNRSMLLAEVPGWSRVLVRLVAQNEDGPLRARAAHALAVLAARSELHRRCISGESDWAGALVRAIEEGDESERMQACFAIAHLAQDHEGRAREIAAADRGQWAEALIRMVAEGEQKERARAALAIGNICGMSEARKRAIARQEHWAEALILAIDDGPGRQRSWASRAVSMLCYKSLTRSKALSEAIPHWSTILMRAVCRDTEEERLHGALAIANIVENDAERAMSIAMTDHFAEKFLQALQDARSSLAKAYIALAISSLAVFVPEGFALCPHWARTLVQTMDCSEDLPRVWAARAIRAIAAAPGDPAAAVFAVQDWTRIFLQNIETQSPASRSAILQALSSVVSRSDLRANVLTERLPSWAELCHTILSSPTSQLDEKAAASNFLYAMIHDSEPRIQTYVSADPHWHISLLSTISTSTGPLCTSSIDILAAITHHNRKRSEQLSTNDRWASILLDCLHPDRSDNEATSSSKALNSLLAGSRKCCDDLGLVDNWADTLVVAVRTRNDSARQWARRVLRIMSKHSSTFRATVTAARGTLPSPSSATTPFESPFSRAGSQATLASTIRPSFYESPLSNHPSFASAGPVTPNGLPSRYEPSSPWVTHMPVFPESPE